MKVKFQKAFQILIIIILLMSIVSVTLCIQPDNDDDGNGDDNGNGNGNGNGTSNNTTSDPITIVLVHHTPDQPTKNSMVNFFVKLESDNPITKVNVIVCKSETGICYAAEKMTETPPNSKEFILDWKMPSDVDTGKKLTYHFIVSDSLDNELTSKDYEIIVG